MANSRIRNAVTRMLPWRVSSRRMVPRRRSHTLVAALCAVTLAWPASAATAQRVATSTTEVEHAPQRVTINVDNAPLDEVVHTIASQAGLIPVIDDGLVPSGARVTLHVRDMTAEEAFQRALRGTGLIAELRAERQVIIVRGQLASVTGGVSGVVTDAATKKPLAGAAVVVDSGKAVRTRENGTFVVTGISAGVHKVVVRLIGYRVYSTPVTIREGATENLVVALTASATALSEVVTTATGDRKRYEVGNAIGTIHADSVVANNVIRNVSDLLQARVPGVVVENTSGDVGAPSKIRLRGVNSVTLNNDPIIILDGVRLNAQTTVTTLETNVGSATMLPRLDASNLPAALAPSRLDDIDPNTIESIDVLRGPSASSLYGTDAANGVIVIKTKKGQVGSWRATLLGDQETSAVPGQMPEQWWGWTNSFVGQYATSCNLAITTGTGSTVAGGGCVQDSVTQFNPENYGPMKTLGTGTTQSLNGTLSGGSNSLLQFFSATVSSAAGMAKMSDAQERLISRLWSTPIPSWMLHPNTQQEVDGTSRTTVNVSPQMDVSLSTNGIYRNVLNGGSAVQNGGGPGAGASPADTLGYVPSLNQRTKDGSIEKRGTLATTASYRPWRWLSLGGTGGGDYGLRTDQADLQSQFCVVADEVTTRSSLVCPSGHTVSRGETFVTTLNGGAQLSFSPRSWLTLQTALGEQYSHTNFYNMQVGNSDPFNCPLQFGTTLLSPSPVCTNSSSQWYTVNESRDESATAGVYLQETVNLAGLYYTFGVRQDVASAFGGVTKSKSPPNYPKFDLSYPISEKSFFPKQPYVTSLRLRLAYGQSGNQASQTAVLNQYLASQITFGTASAVSTAVSARSLGNPDLKPEKGTEWEGGFDVSFLENERIHAEVTMYRKYTRDAIVSITLPPSYGEEVLTQYTNLGNVENRGLEVSLTTRILDTRPIAFDFTVNGSRNTNKLVHKAPSLAIAGPLGTQFREGYPLYGFWGAPVLSYGDANGDGLLEQTEVAFGSQIYMGAPYPKAEVTYNPSLSLWNGAFRLTANFDQIIDQTTQMQVANLRPRAAVDRTAPLSQQAAYIEAVVNNGYFGTSSSVRLNEMSATYNVPMRFVRQLHAQSLAITVAGRNVALWTNYAGKDPDVDTSGLLGEASQDNGTGTPQPRIWSLRFNLGL